MQITDKPLFYENHALLERFKAWQKPLMGFFCWTPLQSYRQVSCNLILLRGKIRDKRRHGACLFEKSSTQRSQPCVFQKNRYDRNIVFFRSTSF